MTALRRSRARIQVPARAKGRSLPNGKRPYSIDAVPADEDRNTQYRRWSTPLLRVALDVRPALSRPTGVGIYIGALADALPAKDPESQFTLFTSSLRERWPRTSAAPNVRVVDRRIPVRVLNLAWSRLEWPTIETVCGQEFDLVHSPHALLTPVLRARRVISIHDLFFFKHPELTGGEVRRDYAPLVKAHARKADGVICPSEHTARDVEILLGVPRHKIGVTPYGVNPVFRTPVEPRDVDPLLRRLGLSNGFILYLGSDEKRKNLGTLVSAYREFAKQMSEPPALVMVGPHAAFGDGDPGSKGRVVSTGYLETHEIRALMSVARCLVLASLEEGFGFPVVEAMSAGLPVVCSRGSSLEEIAGGAAELIDDPLSEDAIVRSLRRVFEDDGRAEQLRAAGLERARLYDWDRTAQLTLDFYRKVVGS
ncbi:MAG: glycosyltransferase family 1 protein [Vicinamibacteria bacterium]